MNSKSLNFIKFFLLKNKIRFSNYQLEKIFINNPNNTDFFGLSQIFSSFGFNPTAHNLDFNAAVEYSDSFLALLMNPIEIITIISVGNKEVEIINEKGTYLKHDITNILNRWSGNVMFLEIAEIKHEKRLLINKITGFINSEKKQIVVFILFSSFLLMLLKNENYLLNSFIFCVNFLGLILSNKLSDLKKTESKSKVCTLIKNGDCTLLTKNARFLNVFEYDRLGIFLFLFYCSIPIFSNYVAFGGILTIISSIILLFPFYSVFYQKYISRTWCILCLGVLGCILLNFVLFFSSKHLFDFDLLQIFNLIVPVAILALITNYYFLKSDYRVKYETSIKRLNKFIAREDIYQFLQSQNASISEIELKTSILINSNGTCELSLLTNPFCLHCKEAYMSAKKLVEENNFSLKIIYLDGNNKMSKIICQQFISIYFSCGEEIYLKSVDAWYSWGILKQNKWKEQFKIDEHEMAPVILKENLNWAHFNDLYETPTFLVNNLLLPFEYEIKDLKYI